MCIFDKAVNCYYVWIYSMVFIFVRFYSSVTHVLVSLQLPHVWCNVKQLEAFFAISNFDYINSGAPVLPC